MTSLLQDDDCWVDSYQDWKVPIAALPFDSCDCIPTGYPGGLSIILLWHAAWRCFGRVKMARNTGSRTSVTLHRTTVGTHPVWRQHRPIIAARGSSRHTGRRSPKLPIILASGMCVCVSLLSSVPTVPSLVQCSTIVLWMCRSTWISALVAAAAAGSNIPSFDFFGRVSVVDDEGFAKRDRDVAPVVTRRTFAVIRRTF